MTIASILRLFSEFHHWDRVYRANLFHIFHNIVIAVGKTFESAKDDIEAHHRQGFAIDSRSTTRIIVEHSR